MLYAVAELGWRFYSSSVSVVSQEDSFESVARIEIGISRSEGNRSNGENIAKNVKW